MLSTGGRNDARRGLMDMTTVLFMRLDPEDIPFETCI